MAGYANVHPEHLELGLEPHRAPFLFLKARVDYGRGHWPNVAVELNEAVTSGRPQAAATGASRSSATGWSGPKRTSRRSILPAPCDRSSPFPSFSRWRGRRDCSARPRSGCSRRGAALDPPCAFTSLLTYPLLLDVARAGGFLSAQQIALLEAWRLDPFGWGEAHGFPTAD